MKWYSNPLLLTLSAPVETDMLALWLGQIVCMETGGLQLDHARLLMMTHKGRRKSNAGAKPQHDWSAYKKQFDDLIDYYGLPSIDEPELKNQAALETKLLEWGEKTFEAAPSESSIRRQVGKWLKEIGLVT